MTVVIISKKDMMLQDPEVMWQILATGKDWFAFIHPDAVKW